jgi:hypothetical protein
MNRIIEHINTSPEILSLVGDITIDRGGRAILVAFKSAMSVEWCKRILIPNFTTTELVSLIPRGPCYANRSCIICLGYWPSFAPRAYVKSVILEFLCPDCSGWALLGKYMFPAKMLLVRSLPLLPELARAIIALM